MTTILEKDVRDLSQIEGLTELPDLMKLMASRCGNLVNTSEIARTLGIANTTLRRYCSLLENRASSSNLQEIKMSKNKRIKLILYYHLTIETFFLSIHL